MTELVAKLVAMGAHAELQAAACCSPTRARSNDTAFKLVRYIHNARGEPNKKKIIARQKGYHGVTAAAASLSGRPPMHQHFDLPLPGVLRVSAPHLYDGGAQARRAKAAFVDRLIVELEESDRARRRRHHRRLHRRAGAGAPAA